MKERKRIPVIVPPGSPASFSVNEIVTDPMGSYTGLVKELDEVPVQDADDL